MTCLAGKFVVYRAFPLQVTYASWEQAVLPEAKDPHKHLTVVQGPAAADANVKAAAYGMSAEALNLDPRQLGQAALQPQWDNNQKLELLRVACQVQFCLRMCSY